MEHVETHKADSDMKNRPRIQTFGYFDLFVDNEPVIFSSPKEKEIVACLVEHDGGAVRESEIMSCIFDGARSDPAQQISFRRMKKNLSRTCEHYHIEHIFQNQNQTMSILRDEVDCDFFSFNDGDEFYIFKYAGQFMREFSWAELTQTELDRRQLSYFCRQLDLSEGPKAVAKFLDDIGYEYDLYS